MSEPTTPPESSPGLLRVLGPGTAVAMVVGSVIGSGIFYKPGRIAAAAGDFPLIITAWLVGGVVCLLGALSLAELAAMLPRAGGPYVYLREAYGRPVAFLFGWTDVLFGKPASTGALAVAFVGALDAAAGWGLSPGAVVAPALLLIAAICWINVLGVIWGGRFQAATTIIKAGFLAAIALLPFAMAAAGSGGFDPANYGTAVDPAKPTRATQFATAMLAVMWAYNGWHAIGPVAEEIRRPERNIPFALTTGVGILIVLYVGVNFAYHGVLSMAEVRDSSQGVAQAMIRKLLAPSGASAAQFGVAAVSAVIMCSTLGAINSNLLEASRVSYAMGRDDVFFRGLGRVHVTRRTPSVAIVVTGLMAGLLVVGVAVLIRTVTAWRDRNVFDELTAFVVFSASLFYFLSVLAVIVLRVRHPEWVRPYRTPGYPVVPAIYLAFYVWFLIAVYFDPNQPAYAAEIGLFLVLLGLPAYFAWRTWGARRVDEGGIERGPLGRR